MKFNTISVIGLGYIGLPTAAMFASQKINVIGVDVNQHAVETINAGGTHIFEPDLDELVRTCVHDGYLRATTKPEQADAFLLAVPTPFKGDKHAPDLNYIKAASENIAPVLKKGDLVILESTCPVGTTEQMSAWLAEARLDLTFPQTEGEGSDIRVAHCPERVLPGHVLSELVQNDRVIGGMTHRCSEFARALYEVFAEGECVFTSARTAELAKLTENSFRDVNIAFANELSLICDKLDIDVWELISLANRHPRVDILQPGPGVGGHCIAVDPWFIVSSTPEQARLIKTAREVNDKKPEWVLEKIQTAIGTHLMDNPSKIASDISIACYGITFKPDIDDIRESPALKILMALRKKHSGKLLIVEPNINQLPSAFADIELLKFDDAFEIADIHVLLVNHKSFYNKYMGDRAVVDTKGIWRTHKS